MTLSLSNAAVVLFIVGFLLLIIARKAQPAGNASGEYFDGDQPLTTHGEVLKVASFNIQTGKSNTGQRNINRAAQTLAQVDIAGVQEVYAQSWSNALGFGVDQTMAIAKPGQFNYLFSATRKRWFREHRGNAILTRIPVESWYTQMLPDQSGKSYRNYTVVKARWNNTTFVFINTHLHTSKGRAEQLAEVLQEFAKHPIAILVGDFNTNPATPELKELLRDAAVSDAIAEQRLDPNESKRIDWILVKGFNVTGGRYLPKGVSDHPYYEAHLTLK